MQLRNPHSAQMCQACSNSVCLAEMSTAQPMMNSGQLRQQLLRGGGRSEIAEEQLIYTAPIVALQQEDPYELESALCINYQIFVKQ